MREARFTPGPWKLTEFDQGFIVSDKNGELVETVYAGEPNACLIAAAPEMYEALKAFVEAYEKSLQLEKTDVALRLAKAALSKAQQESEERK